MCLSEAIRYLETGSFSDDKKTLPFAPVKIFSEKHSLMDNAIIEKNY